MTGHVTGRANRRVAMSLWARDGGRCWRCGGWIDPTLSGLQPHGLTIGHVEPLSLGGLGLPDNLAPEHRSCNLRAGNRHANPRANVIDP